MFLLLIGLAGSLGGLVEADEGMWLFSHPPIAAITARYGFSPGTAWLDHVQRSSVRFSSGGSGSFVSADGLTFTNHHVAQKCLHAISTAERDLYRTGFYARTAGDEARCTDLELDALIDISDVTARVNEGVPGASSVAQAGAKQRANMSRIESDCETSSELRCQVVTVYSGAVYQLYRYKKYTDVRLVFAPEVAVAFFGGDHDNFEFPRWDLDVAFLRVYENGRPAHLDDYLRWSTAELHDGELVFVSGNPGSTDRQATFAQLDFLRNVALPFTLEVDGRRHALLTAWSQRSPENARRAQERIFSLENNLKRNRVYLSSLDDRKLLEAKQDEQHRLMALSDPTAPDPWREIAAAMQVEREIYLPLQLIERRAALPGDLASFARLLVRSAEERPKPNDQRLREYTDAALPSLEQTLRAPTPVYKDLEELLLTDGLQMLKQQLPDDPATAAILHDRTPAETARALVSGTHLDDPAVRMRLYDGGQAAVDASTDSMIVLMRALDGEARRYRARYDDEVASVERIAGGRIGQLRFTQSGFNVAPDATFTLRLSYGTVRGYVEDGRGGIVPKGTRIEPFTTIGGLFDRAERMGNTGAFQLPTSWMDARKAGTIDLRTPMNFVSTADIIGGSSGSPVVTTAGAVAGIVFDGNMQSLPWRFAYDDTAGRAVSVDSRAITEALRHVYGATRLVDELTGRTAVEK